MVKVISLHGYMESSYNRNYQALCQLMEEKNIIAPQLDYRKERPYEILKRIHSLIDSEGGSVLLVGQGLGGFYANLLSKKLDLPCLLTNPCLTSQVCNERLRPSLSKKLLESYAEYASLAENANAHILCSDLDHVIPENFALCSGITPHITEVAGTHSIILSLTEQLHRTLKRIPGIHYDTRILVTSARGALNYVMNHYCIPGELEYPGTTEKYAVLSIQDTVGDGFGFQLTENQFCKGVLTLYFDDIQQETKGLKLMDEEQAQQILDFIHEHRGVSTLLIHCFAGISRSKAVGAIAAEMYHDSAAMFLRDGLENKYVYHMLKEVWNKSSKKR